MRALVMEPGDSGADVQIRESPRGRVIGAALGVNPLAHAPAEIAHTVEQAPGDLVLLHAGWVGTDHAARDIRNWGSAAWTALETLVDHLEASLDRDWSAKRVLLRPHARGVLSDTQRCMKLFFERGRQRVGLALEPCALLEAGMLPKVEDHLTRSFQSLGPLAGAVVLGNLRAAEHALHEDAPLLPNPVEEGLVSPSLLGAPARELGWAGTTLIVVTRDLNAAARALMWEPASA